ncbi:bifunctional folylpolyglutamate synthase/dihydrofolate synthase [Moraxella caviae]|uniref:Dihydrofolate synthase/folylpolyglutamate synthase n=1 Tax=Moraxella caviae TaxID=34060 RepID=A0A1S9ZWB2_9GAMM|nr:bifunctional folylpolyglutamate synthase/dihydrofolate synthase [Moraxella caviae]
MGSIHVSAIDMGLERVLPVARRLGLLGAKIGDSDKKPFVFTVAGTNGKGSTTATIAAICKAAGLKTALYQSPHLVSFTERVRIDGAEASSDELIAAFEAVEQARLDEGLSLSFFEMTTLAALLIFKQANCDVWVLEIGLGGRLDVVNIIEPDVCVITNVGIDHTDWLGDDIEKIGAEKAGIIRKHSKVILGAQTLPDSVYQIAQSLNAQTYQLGKDYAVCDERADFWYYSSQSLTCKLPKPRLSVQNAANAVSAVIASGLPISTKQLAQGLSVVRLAGRFDERVIKGRRWLFDVAHNDHGLAFLLAQFLPHWQAHKAKYPQAKLHTVFSMLGDKDVGKVLSLLQAHIDADDGVSAEFRVADWHVAAIDHVRAMPLDAVIANMTTHLNLPKIHTYDTLDAASQGAISASDEQDLILVFGSFHTIGETLLALGEASIAA